MTGAIVLLSGGIDSATALYMTKHEKTDIYTMNMTYTETYDREAEASRELAAAAHVKEHVSIFLPFYKDLERRYHPPPSDPYLFSVRSCEKHRFLWRRGGLR